MSFINENIIKTLVSDKCDVFAAGGGVADIAAAMTDDFSEVDIKKLQEKLKQNCVVLS